MLKTSKRICIAILGLCVVWACQSLEGGDIRQASTVAAQAQSNALTVYLVRHAEKEIDGTRDPGLTPRGKSRAQALATLLSGVEFTQIHSTDYQRTRDTALPVLKNSDLKALSLYPGSDLPGLAQKIISAGGTHLVVGHSNTTNEVAELISQQSGKTIDDSDYDRLYVVVRKNGRSVLSIVRFDPFN